MRDLTAGSATLVAAGGVAGCVCRYVIGTLFSVSPGTFPWSTFGVNLAGSFLLGMVVGALPPDHTGRLLLGTGFCGGFTTFSTFSVETMDLAEYGARGTAFVYGAASLGLGMLAAVAGASIGRVVAGMR